MTSRLATLRSQLAGLRRARAGVRAATAWSALGIAAIVALAAVFVLDVLFELPVPQRLIVMAVAAALVGWAFWQFTRPLLGTRETDIDMALLVERQQEIDSDLVAALQFEQPEAARWGSPELETAVIDYVASVGRGINVFEGFSRQQMLRRGSLLAGCLLVVLAALLIVPGHLRAFANRLLLGSMHYPTDTRIEQIAVNEQAVLAAQSGAVKGQRGMRPVNLKAAQGRPLKFLVRAAGDLPDKGTIHLQSTGASRSRSSFDLRRLTAEELRAAGHSETVALYSGELPRLLDNVRYKVFLGDAWTDPAAIQMVPLPIVETQLEAVFPRYAESGQDSFDPTARQVAVLEGTTIRLAIESKNKKPLKSAWINIKTGDKSQRYELEAQGDERVVWSLAAAKSPLVNIRQEVRYEIQVVDEDDLTLESPIRGTIRIRPDRPPSGLAEVVHKVVLPTAEPQIEFRAADDFGISRVALVLEVERQPGEAAPTETTVAGGGSGGGSAVASSQVAEDGTPVADDGSAEEGSDAEDGSAASDMSPTPALEIPTEKHRFPIIAGKQPLTGERLPLTGKHVLSLSPLKLAKGDRVKLTLEVTDYRGENERGEMVGTTYASDPLVLEVSDESGVLAAISEADQRSEERLTDIIKRQLGIGESP